MAGPVAVAALARLSSLSHSRLDQGLPSPPLAVLAALVGLGTATVAVVVVEAAADAAASPSILGQAAQP